MEKMSQIALAQMAGYYISKGKFTMATNCLFELQEELNKDFQNDKETK